MEEQPKQKMSKHVCACGSSPLASFTSDPVIEIIKALDDEDALTVLKELTKKEIRSPWPNGLFGMDEQRTSKAMRKLLVSGSSIPGSMAPTTSISYTSRGSNPSRIWSTAASITTQRKPDHLYSSGLLLS